MAGRKTAMSGAYPRVMAWLEAGLACRKLESDAGSFTIGRCFHDACSSSSEVNGLYKTGFACVDRMGRDGLNTTTLLRPRAPPPG